MLARSRTFISVCRHHPYLSFEPNTTKCMITKTLHHCELSLIAFPMCKEKPTLGWGYVRTRTRREKVCPLYCVLGSLRIWKNSAFGSLKICSLPCSSL